MDVDYFKKLRKAYGILTQEYYPQYQRNYSDGYTNFQREEISKNAIIFDFFSQFQNVPFNIFFNKKHIESFQKPAPYFDSETAIITDELIKIHYDLSLIIYCYLCFLMWSDIENMLAIFEDKDFIERFGILIKRDDFGIKYPLIYHKEITDYLEHHIDNFSFIFLLFHRINAPIIRVEGSNMRISINRINNIRDCINNQYQFNNFKIQ
ncbi:hypothetical protein [Flavobacterium tyrosinilyticum]|uniref:hypothetical protein n=1 Tax=Flavobacterium tyrosinilyticum TaxID=1658740 RepID=UPI00202DBE4F|nr:hypothetical protein [Flavobacterium tyrosinilyticum]MCM0666383.1 hypothetical protein [Flavobacterium tyrosinilyticum]